MSAYTDLHIVIGPDRAVREVLACPVGGRISPVPPAALASAPFAGIVAALAEAAPDTSTLVVDNIRYRLEHFRTVNGEAWSLVPSAEPLPLAHFNLPEATIVTIRALGRRRGLVLVTGNFGVGKTILRCSILRDWLEQHGGRAIEWADPPEYNMDGPWGSGYCHQVHIPHTDYPRATHKTKRSRVQYAGFSECRSPESYAAVLEAAMAGPLVITTVPSSSPITAIGAYLTGAGRVDPQAAANFAAALTAVLHVTLHPLTGDRFELAVDLIVLEEEITSIERNYIRKNDLAALASAWNHTSY